MKKIKKKMMIGDSQMKFNGTLGKPANLYVVLFTLLICSLLVGCGKEQQSRPSMVPEVATMTLTSQSVVLTTELPGRTTAYRVAEIRPQVSGLLQKRLFEEGSDVSEDQELYQIDPSPFQAALDNAKAALGRSEANLYAVKSRVERFEELLVSKAVSQQDYDDAVAALKQSESDIEYWKATVKTARINLGYCKVKAPISGRIGKSNVTKGAIVTAYQPFPMATITQLDPIYVDMTQSTTELLRLKRKFEDGSLHPDGENHNEGKLILEDGTTYKEEGTLQFQDVTVDPTTGSVILRVVFPNPEYTLLPGMFVRAVIKEGVNPEAMLIPQQAVSRDQKGRPFALIVNSEDKVELRMLILDRAIEDKWLVLEGLSPSDNLIVDGLQRVRPGVTVKTVPLNKSDTGLGDDTGTEISRQKRKDGGD